MSVAARCLVSAQFAPNVNTSVYVSPANIVTIIDKFTILNSSGSTATLDVFLVPNGGTADNSNKIVSALSLTAGTPEDVTYLQNQVLNIGDFLVVKASAASSIVIRASGRQVS